MPNTPSRAKISLSQSSINCEARPRSLSLTVTGINKLVGITLRVGSFDGFDNQPRAENQAGEGEPEDRRSRSLGDERGSDYLEFRGDAVFDVEGCRTSAEDRIGQELVYFGHLLG